MGPRGLNLEPMNLLESLRETLLHLGATPLLPVPVEKRRIHRVRCNLPVVVVVSDKEAVSGRLVNLSTTGMKLQLDRRLKTRNIYRVYIRSRHQMGEAPREISVRATAMWCRKSPTVTGYEIGFLFFSFADVKADEVLQFFREQLEVPVSAVSQKRRFTRIRRPFHVDMIEPELFPLTRGLRDVSLEGLQWQSSVPFDSGMPVKLRIDMEDGPPIEAEAVVVRCIPSRREDGLWEMAVRFSPLPDRDHRRLASVVERYLRENWESG